MRVLQDFLRFAASAGARDRSRYGRIVLPPRTGKTAIAANITNALGKPATFVVPTKALVEQTAREFETWLGRPVGVVYADRKEPICGGTNVTTYAQLEQCPAPIWAPLADAPLVFVDEAHHAITDNRLSLLESRFRPDALRVALTATPDYDETRTLCRFFPALIHELTLEGALDLGLLAPLRVWVAKVEAARGEIAIVRGDYEEEALGRVMQHGTFADATTRFRYDGQNAARPALIACTTCDQARNLALHLSVHRPAGTRPVGLVLGETPSDERRRLLGEFEAGHLDTLVQVGVLQEEVRVLKEALATATGKTRIPFTTDQRRRLAVKGKALTPEERRCCGQIVRPETILKWFRQFVGRRYDSSAQRRALGRPPEANDIRSLVLKLATENIGWGYTKIRDALRGLKIGIGRTTVATILAEAGIEPAPERSRKRTWKQFLRNHWATLYACDFFSVETLGAFGTARYMVFFAMELKSSGRARCGDPRRIGCRVDDADREELTRSGGRIPSQCDSPDPRSGSPLHEGVGGAPSVWRCPVGIRSGPKPKLQSTCGAIREDDTDRVSGPLRHLR